MPAEKKLLIDIARRHDLLTEAKQIWRLHPLLDQLTMALAQYIGTQPQDHDGRPLLDMAVSHAVRRYCDCQAELGSDQEDTAVAAYIKSMVDSASLIYSQNLVARTKTGDIRWMPFEESAIEFEQKHPDVKLVVEQRERPIFRRSVAVMAVVLKIMPYSLLEQADAPTLFDDLLAA